MRMFGDDLYLYVRHQPRGMLLCQTVHCPLGIRFAGKHLLAQAVPALLPCHLLARRLALHRRPCPLLSFGGAHREPLFPSLRQVYNTPKILVLRSFW